MDSAQPSRSEPSIEELGRYMSELFFHLTTTALLDPAIRQENDEQYRYTSIPSGAKITRLLHLLPGEGDAKLEGRLRFIPLELESRYEALSYAWGPSDKPFRLHVEHGRTIPITDSLNAALLQLRSPHETRRLWVDAVCINQDDLDERAGQVRMMESIYSHAWQVLCWLGTDNETCDGAKALRLIKKIGQTNFRPAREGVALETILESNGLPAQYTDDWRHIYHLLSRPWFQRFWVVQEFVLGHHVQLLCGAHHEDWRDIDLGNRKLGENTLLPWSMQDVNSMRSLRNSAQLACNAFYAMTNVRKRTSEIDYHCDTLTRLIIGDITFHDLEAELKVDRTSFIASFLDAYRSPIESQPNHLRVPLLERCRDHVVKAGSIRNPRTHRMYISSLLPPFCHLLTTDPRDKVFALLGLCADDNIESLQPSYTENVAFVYARFALYLMTDSQDKRGLINLLMAGLLARPPGEFSLALPSWVFDWSRPVKQYNPLIVYANMLLFDACGDTSADIKQASEPNAIHVTVSRVDVVRKTVTLPDWGPRYNAQGQEQWFLDEDGKINFSDEENFDLFLTLDRRNPAEGGINLLFDLKRYFAAVDDLFLCRARPLRSRPGESPEETLWRTLIANTDMTVAPRPTDPLRGIDYGIFRQALSDASDDDDYEKQYSFVRRRIVKPDSWSRTFHMLAMYYSACDTDSGFVGIIPRCAVPGDEVHIILGAYLPVVLRPTGQSPKTYELVGPCYIHGIMNGEFVRDPAWKEERITLV